MVPPFTFQGWRRYIGEDQNNNNVLTYYYENLNNPVPTVWKDPELRLGWDNNTTADGKIFYTNANTTEQTWGKPHIILPKGWFEQINPTVDVNERYIYYTKIDGTDATWDMPTQELPDPATGGRRRRMTRGRAKGRRSTRRVARRSTRRSNLRHRAGTRRRL